MVDPDKSIITLAERYKRNPVITALVKLLVSNVPFGVGSALEKALTTTIANIRAERLYFFFDELASRKAPLTDDEIKSEDFLHAFFATSKAALNTRQKDKIRLFARLLQNYASNLEEFDEFEEQLSILDDLSYREFQVLLVLKHYEESYPSTEEDDNRLQRAERFWDQFQAECETELNITSHELNGLLTRLNRTGLYQTFVGGYLSYEGDRGHLTPNFYKFIERLMVANGLPP